MWIANKLDEIFTIDKIQLENIYTTQGILYYFELNFELF